MSLRNYLEADNNKKQPLSEDLFLKLQEDILTGTLQDGDKLTESKICDLYNVSRTPVRDALRQLETLDLITTVPNRGAFVHGFSKEDILDLSKIHAQNEILAVKLSIERITKEEIEMLAENFDFMEFYTRKNDIPKMLNINSTFHQIIYNSTKNLRFAKELKRHQLYLRYCNPSNYYNPHYLKDVLVEHRDIFDAITSRDLNAGASAMKRHMDLGKLRKFI